MVALSAQVCFGLAIVGFFLTLQGFISLPWPLSLSGQPSELQGPWTKAQGVACLLTDNCLVPGVYPASTLSGPTETFDIIIKQMPAEPQNG